MSGSFVGGAGGFGGAGGASGFPGQSGASTFLSGAAGGSGQGGDGLAALGAATVDVYGGTFAGGLAGGADNNNGYGLLAAFGGKIILHGSNFSFDPASHALSIRFANGSVLNTTAATGFGGSITAAAPASATPEPGSIALLAGIATVGAGLLRRRK